MPTRSSARRTSAVTPTPMHGPTISRPRPSRCRRKPCRKSGRSTAVKNFTAATSTGRRCRFPMMKWLTPRLSRGLPGNWPSRTRSRCFCLSVFIGRTCRGTHHRNISTASRSMKSSCPGICRTISTTSPPPGRRWPSANGTNGSPKTASGKRRCRAISPRCPSPTTWWVNCLTRSTTARWPTTR